MNVNRRSFLSGVCGAAALAVAGRKSSSNPVLAASLETSPTVDPLRPQFHLLPPANWMNDPDGPIFWKGNYHMFYQYNPDGAYWGNMHWGHAISADMVHWRHLPVAFSPTPGGPDADGCFTGTSVLKDGKVFVLYTAVHAALREQATIKEGVRNLRETQCLAISDDPQLRTWVKLPEPVIARPPEGMQVNGFRDPSPWRSGDWWYMVLGTGIEGQGGAILLYKSKDLRSWEYMHVLASRKHDGAQDLSPLDPWEVWECPDFFPLGEKYVLIFSTLRKSFWQTGTLDEESMTFHPERSGLLDYGSYYAPKTHLDKSGNRILWGWIEEDRPLEEYRAAGWAGLLSLPRVLTLDAEGRLITRMAAEVDGLRLRKHAFDGTADEGSVHRQMSASRAAQCLGEILFSARRTSEPFKLVLFNPSESQSACLTLGYDPRYPMQVSIDDHPVSITFRDGENIEFHLYIDGSVIETLVNEQVAWTKRFYYKGTAQDMCLRWSGKTSSLVGLTIWQMSPISADR
jgi:beta-fructofuranosidase